MNICITGALGHIGSELLKNITIEAESTGHLVDNMANQRYCSLFDLPKNNITLTAIATKTIWTARGLLIKES